MLDCIYRLQKQHPLERVVLCDATLLYVSFICLLVLL